MAVLTAGATQNRSTAGMMVKIRPMLRAAAARTRNRDPPWRAAQATTALTTTAAAAMQAGMPITSCRPRASGQPATVATRTCWP